MYSAVEEPVPALLPPVPDSAGSFWSRFMELISTTPELLPIIVCKQLSEEDQRVLRAVNRAMRVALNATVTHIRCCCKALAAHQHLHEVFPNLSSMAVIEQYDVDELREVLQHLARVSSRMLAKLQYLSLSVPMELTIEDEAGPIWEVVNRCTLVH
jgi:hypothetical protein